MSSRRIRPIRPIPTGPARPWPWSPPDSPSQASCLPGLQTTTTPTNVVGNAPTKSPDQEAITVVYPQALVSPPTLPFESTSTSNLPVPTGFVSAPQAVVPPPGSMSRATSQGQPPPLFTPGPNNSQNLTSFPSPQIPTSNVGASGPGPNTSASRAIANRRAPTPFIPRQNHDESDEESESDSDHSGNSAPVIPNAVHNNHSTRSRRRGGGHRHTASMPTAAAPMLFQQPGYNPLLATSTIATTRRPNPLPEPPRILFDRTPFRRLVDLPTSGPPYIAAVNPTMTTALTAVTAAGIPGAVGVGVGGEAGMAGMAGVGAGGGGGGGTQKKKSILMRAFSRRGNDKGQGQAQDYMASLIPVARVIPVVVADNRATASTGGGVIPPPVPGPSTNNTSATPGTATSTPQPPLRYTHTGPYSSLSVRSAHPITYQGKVYPTAMHLFHAMEFMDRFPETAEMIRMIPQTDLLGVFRATSKARDDGKGRPEWRREASVFMPAVSHDSVY